MSLESEYLEAFEVHSPEGIRAALASGASPTQLIKSKRPVDCLIEGYLRSDRFSDCLRVLLDAGATLDDSMLEALLLDDASALRRLIGRGGPNLDVKLRVPCAFTACDGVTPLHICAEFNRVHCARVLLDAGAAVDARADVDPDGLGGQTPIFHTVNSIRNFCRPMLDLLTEHDAALDTRVTGLVWGPGADWETVVLDVTPLSYAQCGLFAQFHRSEADIYANLALLFERRYGAPLPMRNVPNRYLAPRPG
ncbi:MAG: ankyrin repeat domain-containing protein [Gemmatimonadaceae bacterium]|nr:ankyrin repeat domain-containing protein [Gemmatimonadaceae bacterium]